MIAVAMVDRLITKYGRQATHVVSANTPNPTPWFAPDGSEVLTEVTAVFISEDFFDMGSSILKEGEQQVLISGSVADMEKGQIIREGVSPANNPPANTDWKIVHVTIIEPGNVRYLYELLVKK